MATTASEGGAADRVLSRLRELSDPAEFATVSKRIGPAQVIGVRMKHLFDVAKTESAMDLATRRPPAAPLPLV